MSTLPDRFGSLLDTSSTARDGQDGTSRAAGVSGPSQPLRAKTGTWVHRNVSGADSRARRCSRTNLLMGRLRYHPQIAPFFPLQLWQEQLRQRFRPGICPAYHRNAGRFARPVPLRAINAVIARNGIKRDGFGLTGPILPRNGPTASRSPAFSARRRWPVWHNRASHQSISSCSARSCANARRASSIRPGRSWWTAFQITSRLMRS